MQIDIRELAMQAMASRSISRGEHQLVKSMLGQQDLEATERELVARLFYGIRRGLLEVVE
ncbi:MAG: hypothetical protein HC838_09585 [Spirulinaceae cyanobacterium RM2_2_10]|nr:hypothetical protein [Spirulinaceae cyanobacterium SM2_1_0]NJO20240.1 hypothetical protein [Spirulinaceae cyanobacterium RM2_2_10]